MPPWIVWTAPDLCILHTTFLCARWYDGFETYRRRFRWVSALSCPKIALPQDEYDHSAVLEEWLLELDATSIYSCFGPDQRSILYPTLGKRAAFHETLTGFIDDRAAADVAGRMVPHSERPSDLVYRATNLPYWFGSHGQLKHRIADAAQRAGDELGLKMDISTRQEDTIFGARWLDFLMSGRAVIGCESGSSVLDTRGEIQRRIARLLAEHPDMTFEEVDAQMPAGWDSYSFFVSSPLHLMAVLTNTAQVLVEGSYSGVLEPERHYIPVRRDLTNLDQALARLRDVETVEAMTERAYRDIYLEGHNTLEAFAAQLRDEPRRAARRIAVPFELARRTPFPSVPESLAQRTSWVPRGGRVVPLLLTLMDALARDPGARKLLVRAGSGSVPLPLRQVVQDIVLLRVLTRIRLDVGHGGETQSLTAEKMAGTVTIRTHPEARETQDVQIEGTFESVVWNHSAVAQAAPLFPRRPGWGWVTVGTHGRHEFRTLAAGVREDSATARAVLERVLGGRPAATIDGQPMTAPQSEANDQ